VEKKETQRDMALGAQKTRKGRLYIRGWLQHNEGQRGILNKEKKGIGLHSAEPKARNTFLQLPMWRNMVGKASQKNERLGKNLGLGKKGLTGVFEWERCVPQVFRQ